MSRLWSPRRNWRKEWPGTLAILSGLLAGYFLLVSPLLIPTLQAASSGSTGQPIFTVIYNSATLQGFFTPGPSALWALFGSKETVEFRGNFVGFITLVLAGWGLIFDWKKTAFWAMLGSVFGLLALGPVLHVSFEPDWTPRTIEGGLNLPGRLLYNLPFGNIARVPLRFGLVSILALAVLAAFGIKRLGLILRQRLPRARWSGWVVPAVAAVLVFTEFFPGPRTLVATTIPPFYQQLAREGAWNDFAVLEAPDRGNASIISNAMYYQTVHGHPIVGGYLSRKPYYPFKDTPGITELLSLDTELKQSDILDRSALQNIPGVLAYYNIRYVVVHTALLTDPDSRYNANWLLQTVFGPGATPFYQDEELQVWKTPFFVNKMGSPEVEKLLPELGEGWGNRVETENGPQRGVVNQARLVLFNPFDSPLPVKIKVKVSPENSQVNLDALLNGKLIYRQTSGILLPSQTLELTGTLSSGFNEVVFQTTGMVYFGRFSFVSSAANPAQSCAVLYLEI